MLKSIAKTVVSREQAEGVGARVRRSIGTHELRNLDPFLMLDEFKVKLPSGFPDHPHRGFETVTFMLEGTFEHEDFMGHRGVIEPGDVQWMTAGRGIVHAEMPKGPEVATGLQLWLNLPAKAKMIDPNYQELSTKDIPLAQSPDGKVDVKVIAGESYDIKAKIHTYSPIYYLHVKMQPDATFEQKIPANYTAFAYTLKGSPKFAENGPEAPEHATLVFGKDGDEIKVTSGSKNAEFVIIAGEPIGEPIVQHGPFVMNTKEEIMQAMMDYQLARNGFENAPKWESEIQQRSSLFQ
ncbi:RmlC-like cupin domain-containing protein [Gorgonomyces haynaldii]|nr:RmlC-like cupin domain-containing protein [Gorgonomyces haynaldii]